MTDWLANDELFREQLIAGRRTEEILAVDLLLDYHLGVKIEELEWRAAQGADFNDQADVQVGGGHVLEVKSRELAFTCPDDYPFPTVYLGNGRRWLARQKRPCYFVIVSSTGCRLAVSTATADDWEIASTYDSIRGIENTVLVAPSSLLVPFDELIGHLRSRCDGATLTA